MKKKNLIKSTLILATLLVSQIVNANASQIELSPDTLSNWSTSSSFNVSSVFGQSFYDQSSGGVSAGHVYLTSLKVLLKNGGELIMYKRLDSEEEAASFEAKKDNVLNAVLNNTVFWLPILGCECPEFNQCPYLKRVDITQTNSSSNGVHEITRWSERFIPAPQTCEKQ